MRGLIMTMMLATALVSVTTFSSAFAIPPVTEPLTLDFVGDVMGDCDGFQILHDSHLTGTQTTFFNDAGEAIRLQWRVSGTDIFYNSSNPDIAVEGTPHATLTIDLQTGDFVGTGLLFHVNIPSVGVVLIQVGTFIQAPDGSFTFLAGQHPILFDGQAVLPKLCAVLAD